MKAVTEKIETLRKAVAESVVVARPESIRKLLENELPKKDVLVVARVAGITAAKKCSELIPYCHPLPIDFASVEFDVRENRITITATVEAIWKTGVEMEALCAVTVAALCLYDMAKGVDKELRIEGIALVSKSKEEGSGVRGQGSG